MSSPAASLLLLVKNDINLHSPSPVSHAHLTSKEWCDLVFEGRNRDYGAYRIRQRTGKRYARALAVVLTLTLVLSVTYTAYAIYERYQVALALKDAARNWRS